MSAIVGVVGHIHRWTVVHLCVQQLTENHPCPPTHAIQRCLAPHQSPGILLALSVFMLTDKVASGENLEPALPITEPSFSSSLYPINAPRCEQGSLHIDDYHRYAKRELSDLSFPSKALQSRKGTITGICRASLQARADSGRHELVELTPGSRGTPSPG
jgi:hypothetical protein